MGSMVHRAARNPDQVSEKGAQVPAQSPTGCVTLRESYGLLYRLFPQPKCTLPGAVIGSEASDPCILRVALLPQAAAPRVPPLYFTSASSRFPRRVLGCLCFFLCPLFLIGLIQSRALNVTNC